ncbi:MAG: hypothetical protein FJ088_11765 [Deltaproteobacteria bacterium]|nr:hypothetical protein [Deltaproteobacteria bacterium]
MKMKSSNLNDLIVLVADKNMEFAIKGILQRTETLKIRPLKSDIHVHPERDPGCYLKGPDFLSSFCEDYKYAILIMDYEGSGHEHHISKAEIEDGLESQLASKGWENRSCAIVIEPELDVWVWSDSPEVDNILGWADRRPRLRDWLNRKGFAAPDSQKPHEPKNALNSALYEVRKPRSSRIYQDIATKVSLKRCVDPAFLKLKSILMKWFGKDKPL